MTNLGRRSMLVDALAATSATAILMAGPTISEAKEVDGARRTRAKAKSTYNAYQVGEQKGIESLTIVKRKMPVPRVGEVLVRVRASALNSRDTRVVAARYGGQKPETRIPVGDGAGDVVAIGPEVSGISVGDRVTSCQYPYWVDGKVSSVGRVADLGNSIDGWLAEFAVIPAAGILKIPDVFTYEEAACFPIAAATVWHCIVTFGQIGAGETMLTLGTGGISVMALQLARIHGARVAITSSSDEKLAKMKELGAEILVNYVKNEDWGKEILKATGGAGVDVITETGGPETIARSIACCGLNGRIALLTSVSDKQTTPPNITPLLGKNLTIKGVTCGSRRMLEQAIMAFVINGARPVIEKVFDFSQAKDALRFMADRNRIGKVVIRHV